MNDILYFNGRFTTTAERVLGVEDRGFQFGDALYEVFKFLGRKAIYLPEHFRRLENGLRAIESGNSSGDAFTSVDRFTKCGPVLRCVFRGHRTNAQVLQALVGHGETNQSTAEAGHKIDGFGRNFFRGKGEVAFVFPVLVVHDDDHFAGANICNRAGNIAKRRVNGHPGRGF